MHRFIAFAVLALAAWGSVRAGEVSVAVAANFSGPMRKIVAAFEADTGHKAVLAFGATGAFYSQIRSGAPFQMLLSADDQTPARLEREGLGVVGTRFTYAVGRLMLWSAQPGVVDAQGQVLASGNFQRLAIANPRLAPYGQAALETLTRLKLLEHLQPRLVQGENIAQTFQFVATGNAQLGLVALSQVMVDGAIAKGSGWVVPAHLHAPIRQDALTLAKGQGNPAAGALAAYLKSEKARAIVRSYGYDI